MADPTPIELQTQIDELKGLITTEYQPPSGDEYSYPVVGQPMNDEQWQYVTLSMGSGIMDEGGRPYWLRNNGTEANTNSTNTMLLTVSTTTGTAQAAVRGFYHKLMADKVVSFPGVTSETTYYVVLRYDPLGHKEPSGPISVEVTTSLDSSQGKFNVVLWSVARQPNQLLTDATIKTFRPKLIPTIIVDKFEELPIVQEQMWGTLAIVSTGSQGAEIVRAGGTDPGSGPSTWVSVTHPTFTDPGDTATFVWPGHGARRGWRRLADGNIEFRGRIAKADGKDFYAGGNGGQGYQIYTLSPEESPINTARAVTPASGYTSASMVIIAIYPDGRVLAFPMSDTPWVSLDGVRFYGGK